MSEYGEWCERKGVEHGHCPDGCDHPQPALGDDGEAYCMVCWFTAKKISRMIPCTPEVCR